MHDNYNERSLRYLHAQLGLQLHFQVSHRRSYNSHNYEEKGDLTKSKSMVAAFGSSLTLKCDSFLECLHSLIDAWLASRLES
jgi:hypothetical protein